MVNEYHYPSIIKARFMYVHALRIHMLFDSTVLRKLKIKSCENWSDLQHYSAEYCNRTALFIVD